MDDNKSCILMNRLEMFCPHHINPETEVIWVKQGSVKVSYDTQELCLQPGEMTLILPYHLHSFVPSKDAVAFVYMFPQIIHQDFSESMIDGDEICRICSLEPPVAEFIDYLLAQIGEEKTILQAKCLFYTFCNAFLKGNRMVKSAGVKLNFAPEVLRYIFEHLDEDFDIGNIARYLGWDPRKLSTLFRERYGIKLTELINNIRVERAITLLETTGLSISEVASSSGFGSLRNFNRIFQMRLSCTPSQYRQRRKESK